MTLLRWINEPRRDYRAVFTVRGSRVEHRDPFTDQCRLNQEIGLVLQDAGASILTRFLRNHRWQRKKRSEKEGETERERERGEEKRIEILKFFGGCRISRSLGLWKSSGPFARLIMTRWFCNRMEAIHCTGLEMINRSFYFWSVGNSS